jgi:hypothetical protein
MREVHSPFKKIKSIILENGTEIPVIARPWTSGERFSIMGEKFFSIELLIKPSGFKELLIDDEEIS